MAVEIDAGLLAEAERGIDQVPARSAELAQARLQAHLELVDASEQRGRKLRHWNEAHGFAVTTSQEREMEILTVSRIERVAPGVYRAEHERAAVPRFSQGELF